MRKDRPSGNLSQECHRGVRHGGDEPDHPEIAGGPSARPELTGRKFSRPAARLPGCSSKATCADGGEGGDGMGGGGGLTGGSRLIVHLRLGSDGSFWFQLRETKRQQEEFFWASFLSGRQVRSFL